MRTGNDEGVGAARPWSSPRAAPARHDRSGARAATLGTVTFLLHFLQGVRQVIDATLREFAPARASTSESAS